MAASGDLPALPPVSGLSNKLSCVPASPFRAVAISSGLSVRRALCLHAARQFRHFFLQPFVVSSCKAMRHSDQLIKCNWSGRYLFIEICSILEAKANLFSWFRSSFSYFNGGRFEKGSRDEDKLNFERTGRNPSKKLNSQVCTNILIAVNVLLYGAEILTQGKLMMWGAKINGLIKQGQVWRLVTSAFLHANFMHLLVNSYSLNSVGPPVEKISGLKRFLAVYLTSAIASSILSYRFCRSPSVGASGAIFGLVGSLAVFVVRHRKFIGGGKEEMQQIAHVIALNMIIGLLSRNTDNWGHLGGLLGGAAVSWFVGPAWSYEFTTNDGRIVFADKAPVLRFINRKRRQ